MKKYVLAAALLTAAGSAQGQVIINEIIQDPPGSESNWELIELYGRPGMDLTGYALGLIKGGEDTNGDGSPEVIAEIDEAYSLDGLALGPSGFLVLLSSPVGDASFFTDADATVRTFAQQHIPTIDTAGSLANGGSSSYVLVRARPNHRIENGESIYEPGYAFRKDVNPDVNFDGKIDFGIESGAAFEIDPLQVVDDMAWSDAGGKEYVRSSEQEISDTPGFDPDAVSRVNYFNENPGLGDRVNGSGQVVPTRMADESWVYGEILRLPQAIGELPEFGFEPQDMQPPKGPTDLSGPLYDCPPSPTGEIDCAPSGSGTFLFDDITLVENAGQPDEFGFNITPGTFNDDARFGVTQFRFVAADFNFDGLVDSTDLSLIQARLGATLDDRIDCLDEFGDPIIDPETDLPFQCFEFEGRALNALEAMRSMDATDGPGGGNAAEVTPLDIAAVEALVGTDRLCADTNGDGAVNGSDFFAWVAAFGTNPVTSESLTACDVNSDAACNGSDFFAWVAAFGQGPDGPTCTP
ncbi:MAG: dockerin type I domain-containing protein [Planctomycetota bacterium]